MQGCEAANVNSQNVSASLGTNLYNSGFGSAHAPRAFQKVENTEGLVAAPSRPAAVTVVESLDRSAHDVIIQSVLIKRCIDAGILLFAANTGQNVCDAFLMILSGV